VVVIDHKGRRAAPRSASRDRKEATADFGGGPDGARSRREKPMTLVGIQSRQAVHGQRGSNRAACHSSPLRRPAHRILRLSECRFWNAIGSNPAKIERCVDCKRECA